MEVLDDPSLAGRPVIVGGPGARGVVAAVHLRGAGFGIHSAMPSVEARRRCPHAVFLPGRFPATSEMSERLHAVLRAVHTAGRGHLARRGVPRRDRGTSAPGRGPPSRRGRSASGCTTSLQLECSVGVARTKLIAKLASQGGQARRRRRRDPPGPGSLRGPARTTSCRSCTLCRSGPCGASARHRPAARRPGRHHRRRPGRASRRTLVPLPRHAPTGASCRRWPGATTPARWRPTTRPSRSGTRRPSRSDICGPRRPAPPRAAHGRRRRRPSARGAAGGPDGDGEGPLRGLAPRSRGRTRWGRPSTRPVRSGPSPGRCSTRWTCRRASGCSGVSLSGLVDTDTTARQLSFDDGDEAARHLGPVDEAGGGPAAGGREHPRAPRCAHGPRGAGAAGPVSPSRARHSLGRGGGGGGRHPGPLRQCVGGPRHPGRGGTGWPSRNGATPSGARAHPRSRPVTTGERPAADGPRLTGLVVTGFQPSTRDSTGDGDTAPGMWEVGGRRCLALRGVPKIEEVDADDVGRGLERGERAALRA